MKSVLISFVMFAVVLAAMYFDVFEILSSKYMYIFAFVCLGGALVFAFRVLGNPWSKKDNKHD